MSETFLTNGGCEITRKTKPMDYGDGIKPWVKKLESCRGALFSSSFEYPGRYTRWDIGFYHPPLQITLRGLSFSMDALNQRGKRLLGFILPLLSDLDFVINLEENADSCKGQIRLSTEPVAEELRSKQPSVFALLRHIMAWFHSSEDKNLGLYGAFGYDLIFQFEQLTQHLPRDEHQRDLVLYLPDRIMCVDHQQQCAYQYDYEFTYEGVSTQGLPRDGQEQAYQAHEQKVPASDHQPGEFARLVDVAKEKFKRGDLFEVVPGQTFQKSTQASPGEIFLRLQEQNPSPYGFFINLGEEEYLIGASPEMYVRVSDKRVETCPISGTISRGESPIEDAANILTLLNSKKDESELTMCTDVDRNDKSRICVPGSVKVIGRRQLELYSRLIHTVDHVEGILREGYDALDAFLSHMWVVTVTGAPKLWAMQFIEQHEKSPRRWYGGSVGMLKFNGDINTGLTLRTARLHRGVAEVRAGATLLFDSDPIAEEKETELKASALLKAITELTSQPALPENLQLHQGAGKKVLLVDYQDSFVHTLANYLRQTGAQVFTHRYDQSASVFTNLAPDLVFFSPGPGCPKDFAMADLLTLCLEHGKAIFGVCLGLQGIVEYYGGELAVLDYPMHGKSSLVKVNGGRLFRGLPEEFLVGRYHSLYIHKSQVPSCLRVTAETEEGIVMAIEHKHLPIQAVQFHPESILSMHHQVGLKLVNNIFG